MCPKDGQNRIAIPKTARAKARGQKKIANNWNFENDVIIQH